LLLLYEEEEEAVRLNSFRRRRLKTVKTLAFVFVNASAQEVVLKRTVSVRVVLIFFVFFCPEEEALKKVVLMVQLLEEIIIISVSLSLSLGVCVRQK
jgi:hypothetical protein